MASPDAVRGAVDSCAATDMARQLIRSAAFMVMGIVLPASRASQAPVGPVQFDVRVSEARTVHSSPAGGGTGIIHLANGDIVNQYWEGDGKHPYALISSDSGKTWLRTIWPGDSACLATLSDGTVLAINYMSGVRKIGP